MALHGTVFGEERVDTLTYAVFPYLPDIEYYQELIEERWAKLEPDIELVRANWDCYYDDKPEGIDVVMYDAVMRDTFVNAGWIEPIDPKAVQESEDIYAFALEGLTVQDKLYGIPVFLCGNFLIYDRDYRAFAAAERITDLAQESEILVINIEDSWNRPQYIIEILADMHAEANPKLEGSAEANLSLDESAKEIMSLVDTLAIKDHKKDEDPQVALAYDAGIGQGFIGFSENMRFLKERFDQTEIKAISFSNRENMSRVYVDAVAVTAGVEGLRLEKCLELMNVCAEADVLTALSVQEGEPQYLLLARRSPYKALADFFPMYSRLEKLANNEKNHVILIP